jgi:hypothetical protein
LSACRGHKKVLCFSLRLSLGAWQLSGRAQGTLRAR